MAGNEGTAGWRLRVSYEAPLATTVFIDASVYCYTELAEAVLLRHVPGRDPADGAWGDARVGLSCNGESLGERVWPKLCSYVRKRDAEDFIHSSTKGPGYCSKALLPTHLQNTFTKAENIKTQKNYRYGSSGLVDEDVWE